MSREIKEQSEVWFEDKTVFMAMLKDFQDDLGVRMLTRSEYKGKDVLQRWVCASHPYKHKTFWASPGQIIEWADKGESGCPVCRELAVEETVSFKELSEAATEQEKRSDKAMQKARTKQRHRGQVMRFAT